jgi:hypothetical protein
MAAMATYVRAGLPEVATALAALTGEPHPLAVGTGFRECSGSDHGSGDDVPGSGEGYEPRG